MTRDQLINGYQNGGELPYRLVYSSDEQNLPPKCVGIVWDNTTTFVSLKDEDGTELAEDHGLTLTTDWSDSNICSFFAKGALFGDKLSACKFLKTVKFTTGGIWAIVQ